jgi:hypothetical protein
MQELKREIKVGPSSNNIDLALTGWNIHQALKRKLARVGYIGFDIVA